MRRTVVLVALALAFPSAARAQISPGELARPHEPLEGMKNCMKCHELGAGPSAEKCLACHNEIAERIDAKGGYHHLVVAVGRRACFECHSDHAGRAFALIHWPDGKDRFDHSQAGWKLGGAHASLACRDCHRGSRVSVAFAKAHGSVDTTRTFLGLDEACLACHADAHAGQFARDCTACHGDASWKPASRFDHAQTAFPLEGRHRETECVKCHATVARQGVNVIQYAGVAHESCTACHTDPHAGRLGGDCASCHGQDAWRPVTRFDHARTDFPLTGLHQRVECVKCHTSAATADARSLRYAGLPHDNCAPCHTDPHAGRLGADCAVCHDTAGWKAVRVARSGSDGFDHGRTRFPLVGRHAGVACEKCHKSGGKTTDLAFDACDRCHRDVHEGQFAHRAAGGACEQCHDVNGFVPARFTAADHARTRFALAGAHLAQPCVACHPVEQFPSGNRCRRFTHESTACEACHSDPHAGQFSRTAPAKTCDDCHTIDAWSRLDFDHDTDTAYRLEGEHRAVSCARCHVEQAEGGARVVRYRSTPTTCEACHSGKQLELGGRS